MPKKVYTIRAFHGGLNSNSDPRDIAENELAEATDVMVDELGKIRLMGGEATHGTIQAQNDSEINPGYGLFQFSHDRTGADLKVEHKGTYTHGSDSGTVLIDSAAAFTSGLVGGIARNLTDGSTGTVVSVDSGTQLTVDDLLGGTDDLWDASEDDEYTISWPETGDDYLAFSDPDTQGTVDIYSNAGNTWGSPITGMTNNSSGLRKDVFYTVDGALRVCDSDFGNSNSNKWYGYVDRRHFNGVTPGGSADAYDTWHLASAEIVAPTRGIVGQLSNSSAAGDASTTSLTEGDVFTADWENEIVGHIVLNETSHETVAIETYTDADTVVTAAITGQWASDNFKIFPPAGTGFNLNIAASGSAATITAGTYEFATTFIYDKEPGDPSGGDQESILYLCKGAVAVSANEFLSLKVYANAPYDARITGGRVYTRIQDSNNDWQQISEISLKNGIRGTSFSMSFKEWGNEDATNNATTLCLDAAHLVLSLPPVTYGINAGISQDASSTTAKYKTAVVANRIAYVGNVQYDGTIYGDAVFKSPVNKFDVFSSDRILEANINDGDSIVKLEAYADRLLIFKKKKLELLNISQEVEFVEDTFMHKGVSHPAATCKTDFGIAWVNKQGCYLYDGQRVNNLLEKQGRQIIKESDWATFTTREPMIGYIPKKRQLLVVDDNTSSGDGKTFLYDMVTQSWVKGADATITSQALTNFVTDWNGDLVYAHTTDQGTFVKWDDASATTSTISFKTKDIDFGEPSVRKKVYKVYVSYKGDGRAVTINYTTNGDNDTYDGQFFRCNADGSSTKATASNVPLYQGSVGTDDWINAELKPTTSINNIKSFQLKFDGETTDANFEINDISIVYRIKNIK